MHVFFTKKKEKTVKVGNKTIVWNPSGSCWDEVVNYKGSEVTVKYIVSPCYSDPSALVAKFKSLDLFEDAYEYTVLNCRLTYEHETEDYNLMAVIVSPLSIEFLYSSCYLGPRHCVCTEYDYRMFHDCYIK